MRGSSSVRETLPTAVRESANSRGEPDDTADCGELMARTQPGIAATYSFDAGAGAHEPVMVRFVGRRIGAKPSTVSGDRFEKTSTVEGSALVGHLSVTTRVPAITAGQWTVTARPLTAAGRTHPTLSPVTFTTSTRFAPTTFGPRVWWAAWPTLVGIGVVAAITTQALLFARFDHRWWVATVITLVACGVGFPCAKIYFLALHRGRRQSGFLSAGACIQGFLIGAVAAIVGQAVLFGLPIGTLLDATTPGVFVGIAIGRPGCLLAGCCVGRPTASRWAIWSSDRRIAVRRYPVPLIEAGFAVVLAATTLSALLVDVTDNSGALFIASMAAYVLCRQLLFPLREDPHTGRGRMWTTTAAAAVITAAIVMWAL